MKISIVKLNRLIALALVLCGLLLEVNCFEAWAQNWEELKGDHFIIFFFQGGDKFAKEVLKKAEKYYTQISADLGHERYSDFWQWDQRVKIYIYPTEEAYRKYPGSNPWSHGLADYSNREIRSYAWKEGFLEALLPHELTHLIFRDYVGFSGQIPLWLDEGVAQWEEPAKREIVKQAMQEVLKKGEALPLKTLTETDVRNWTDSGKVTAFYIQAMSIVDFLVTRFGAGDFIAFCRQLRDGKSFQEALMFSYPTAIRDLSDLEGKWKSYLADAA